MSRADEYRGPERRSGISEADAQRIATMAAKEAIADFYEATMDKVYADIGRGVVSKFLYGVGALVVAFAAYAKAKGWV